MSERKARRERPRPEPDPDAVAVAYIHSDDVKSTWTESMFELLGYDFTTNARLFRGGRVAIRMGTDGLVDARNMAVREFLNRETAPWLWWIDTDMGFEPDALERLVQVADPKERPVVGALCFVNREDKPDGRGGWRTTTVPTLYNWVKIREQEQERQGFAVRWDYPADTVVRVDGTGSAFVLIHRSVLEAVHDEYGDHWYDRVLNPTSGKLVGEDLSFCMRVRALQIPIHVHTGVSTTHVKPRWLGEEDYWDQRTLAGFKQTPSAEETSAAPDSREPARQSA